MRLKLTMFLASLRRFPRSPYWFACFTLPDGRRTQQSTKSSDRKEAQRIAHKFEDAADEGRTGKLIEGQARKVIAEIFAIGNKDELPNSTLKEFLASWLKRKELEAGEATHVRYGVVVEQFLKHLGTKANADISHLTSREITAFRDDLAKRLAANTVNFAIKAIRAALNQAKRGGLVESNQADRVTLLKRRGQSKRRPFTMEELKKILKVANEEWQGMVLVGLYTGLRLGDIANLTWANIDLQNQQLTVATRKTGRSQNLPIAKPLLRHLELLSVGDDPQQPLFPRACKKYDDGGHSRRPFLQRNRHNLEPARRCDIQRWALDSDELATVTGAVRQVSDRTGWPRCCDRNFCEVAWEAYAASIQKVRGQANSFACVKM